MRFIIPLGLTVLLAGCAANSSSYYTQSVKSWQGGQISDVIKAWGRPYETIATPGGNTNYVYKRQSFYSTNTTYSPSIGINPRDGGAAIITPPNVNSQWNRGFTAYCLTVFIANHQGKIIDTKTQGANCYSSQSASALLANPQSKKS